MRTIILAIALLLTACGFVVEPACDHANCNAEWTYSCTEITCGETRYDIWEVPGWEHSWDCARYNGDWRGVRLTWGAEGSCFTEPAVEVGECFAL